MSEVDGVIQVTGLTPESVPDAPAAPLEMPAGTEAVGNSREAEPAEQPAAAEDEQQATPQAADAPNEQESAEPTPEPPKKPARGVQKALDRLTARATAAEQQRDQSNAALQEIVARFAASQRQQPAPQPAPPQDTAPKREQFADWEQYNQALAVHAAEQASARMLTQTFQQLGHQVKIQQAVQAVQQEQFALNQKLAKALDKAPQRFKDWDDVVVGSDAPLPPSLERALKLSEDPALVAHYLGANPDAHARMLRMSPEQQLYEVGRIVASSSPTVVSKAPRPAKPVGGNRAGVGSLEYNENFTPQQHKAWLARQSGA